MENGKESYLLKKALKILWEKYPSAKMTKDKDERDPDKRITVGPVTVRVVESGWLSKARFRVTEAGGYGKPYRLLEKAERLPDAVAAVWGEITRATRRSNEKERAERSEKRRNAKLLKGTGFRMEYESMAVRKFGRIEVTVTLDNGRVSGFEFGPWSASISVEDFKKLIVPALEKVGSWEDDDEEEEEKEEEEEEDEEDDD